MAGLDEGAAGGRIDAGEYGATTTCPSATSLSIFATSASLVVRLAIGGRLPSP